MRTSRIIFVALVVVAGTAGAYWWQGKSTANTAAAANYKTTQEADNVYVRFDMEAYDDIQANYWQQGSDAQFSQLFQSALTKAGQNLSVSSASNATLSTSTRDGVAQMLSSAFAGLSTTTQDQLALTTLQVALYNLAPVGRSGVLSSAAQQ